MKYRHGSSKIKRKHHMIKDLEDFLKEVQEWDEVKAIIPGEIKAGAKTQAFKFTVQYPTGSGLKCKAHCGGTVQEVFFVTIDAEALSKRLKEHCG